MRLKSEPARMVKKRSLKYKIILLAAPFGANLLWPVCGITVSRFGKMYCDPFGIITKLENEILKEAKNAEKSQF